MTWSEKQWGVKNMNRLSMGALLFFAGIVVGVFVVPGRGSESPLFVQSGPIYDGQVKLLGRFVKSFLAREAKGCADLYAENATYMIPETPVLEGHAKILRSYKEIFSDQPSSEMEMSEPVVEVLAMGDWAVLRGTGSSTETTESKVEIKTYKWVILSHKQNDGSWKMVWDIFNYDAPYSDNVSE